MPNENDEIKPLVQRARYRKISSFKAILKENMWPVRPVGHWSWWCLAEIQQIVRETHIPQRVIVRILAWHAGERGFDRKSISA